MKYLPRGSRKILPFELCSSETAFCFPKVNIPFFYLIKIYVFLNFNQGVP